MRTIDEMKESVIDFLENENYDVKFAKEFKGYFAFICVDTTIPEEELTGLPIFVLVNDEDIRFADADETLELVKEQ